MYWLKGDTYWRWNSTGTLTQLEDAKAVYRETLVREGAAINLPSPRAAMNSGAIAFSHSALKGSGEGAFLVRNGDPMSTLMMDFLTSLRVLFLALKTH